MRFFLLAFLFSAFVKAATIDTLSGNFIQTLLSPEADTVTYKGYLYIDSNERALWVYETPSEKKIFISNEFVTVVEPPLEQAIITKLDSTYKISSLLKETLENGETSITHSGVLYTVSFKDSKPTTISYADEMENQVTILLENVIINEQIDNNLFIPQIPSHYDTIRH